MFGDDNGSENAMREVNYDLLKDDHLPTGVKELDEGSPYGFPQGSFIVVMGDERSMSNLFGLHMASTGQPTQYLTTLRPAQHIREEIDTIGNAEEVEITDMFRETDDHAALLKSRLSRVRENGYFILESLNEVNFPDETTYRQVMRNLYKGIKKDDKNGIVMLHLQKGSTSELTETERQILNLADITLHIDSAKVGGDLEHDLKIFKMRGMQRMPEQVYKLKFGDRVKVDAARDI